jgi:hypothetical protein
VLQLLVTASVVPSTPILVILMMETIHSSETSILTTGMRRDITEDGILKFSLKFSKKKKYYNIQCTLTLSQFWTSPILVTLINEALSSSESSVLTRATRRNIPEDTILHSHRRENLKSYINNFNNVWGPVEYLRTCHSCDALKFNKNFMTRMNHESRKSYWILQIPCEAKQFW